MIRQQHIRETAISFNSLGRYYVIRDSSVVLSHSEAPNSAGVTQLLAFSNRRPWYHKLPASFIEPNGAEQVSNKAATRISFCSGVRESISL